jgi:hypothetical protein
MLRGALRTSVRVGAAARRRIQDGGPRATGRPAASLEEWTAIRRVVFRRSVAAGAPSRFTTSSSAPRGARTSISTLVALCPSYHAQTDTPYAHGRLIITPLGNGRFTVAITQGADKWGDPPLSDC